MRLPNPRVLDLSTVTSSHWLQVDASVQHYVPGTTVYLIITTQPTIIGSARVDANGNVSLAGLVPLDSLATGVHSVRIVGVRELAGVTTDALGQVHLSDATLSEIKTFDNQTTALVEVVGIGSDGTTRTAALNVALQKDFPWWLLLLTLLSVLLLLALRYNRRLDSTYARIIAASGLVIVASIASSFGWTSWGMDVVVEISLLVIVGLAIVFVHPHALVRYVRRS